MNNDIKEILKIDENADYKRLSIDEILILGVYITYLQEKVDMYENPDDLTLFYMWLDEKAKDKIKQLQERCEYLERSNNRREDEILSLRDECVDGETYKSRNEKANALLDEMLERAYIDGEYIMYDYSTSELLEVKQALKGEDKDD